MNVIQYKKKLKRFNVQSNVEKAVVESSDEIVNLNKINLSKGLNSLGKLVGKYSPFTAAWTKKFKPNKPKIAGTNYNFDWTGAFINGIFITYENNKVKFFSRGMGLSKKTRFIKNNKLLGLGKSKIKSINNKILAPQLRSYFRNHMEK